MGGPGKVPAAAGPPNGGSYLPAWGPARVLIADDEEVIRRLVSTVLGKAGFEARQVGDGESALQIIRQDSVDVALVDVNIRALDGMEVLRQARKAGAQTPIIVTSSSASRDAALEAMKSGAFAYVTKPFEQNELVSVVERACGTAGLARPWGQPGRQARPGHRPAAPFVAEEGSVWEGLGWSERMRKVYGEVERVAPTDFTVVVTGETGSGKELVAKAIHQLSRRSAGAFVPVDCGSIPAALCENELFGHEKGAFTGADRAQPGKFEVASGGTLFLDEVSNLPAAVQPKLLRALQEKQVWPVGATRPVTVDIRVVAAANQDLATLVEAKRFRRDLYHRLNEFTIVVPSLHEQSQDIVFLAQRFLIQANKELGKRVAGVSAASWEVLLAYSWPGNVRELQNVIRRAALLADDSIQPEHLGIRPSTSGARTAGGRGEPAAPAVWRAPGPAPASGAAAGRAPGARFDGHLPFKQMVQQAVRRAEQEILTQVLRETGGNKAKAARILQIDYKTIHSKVKQYGIAL
jgi:two-component system nitrogen regulation response regulator GlnG